MLASIMAEAPEPVDEAALPPINAADTLTALEPRWQENNGGLEVDLRSIPVAYSEDDTEAVRFIQAIIVRHRKVKNEVDRQFHAELHRFQKDIMPCAPIMLDFCDLLDGSLSGEHGGREALGRYKDHVSKEFQILQLHRRRRHLSGLLDLNNAIMTWFLKYDTLINHVHEHHYQEAARLLGARSFDDRGSPSGKRTNMLAQPVLVQSPPKSPVLLPASPTLGARTRGLTVVRGAPTAVSSSQPHSPVSGASSPPPQQQMPTATTESSSPAKPSSESEPQRPSLTAATDTENPGVEPLGEEWLCGIGSTVVQTQIGEFALRRWAALVAKGSAFMMDSLELQMWKQMTDEFNADVFVAVLLGLRALNAQGETMCRLVVNFFQKSLDRCIIDTLQETLGVTMDSWESIVDTLVPSEYHTCTLAIARAMSRILRAMLRLKHFCSHYDGDDDSIKMVCKELSTLDDRAAQKCLAVVVAYISHGHFERGDLGELLHVYYILDMFVDACQVASNDGAVVSTRGTLLLCCNRLIVDAYQSKSVESILKVLNTESFDPFPANSSDLVAVFKLGPNPIAAKELECLKRYMANVEDGGDIDNPLSHNTLIHDSKKFPAEVGEAVQDIFEQHPLFTFSSLMTCKRMQEFVDATKNFPSASGFVLEAVSYTASVYFYFIVTHFVAVSEAVPLSDETGVPAAVRAQALAVREITQKPLPSDGYPQLPNAMCHGWKRRATDPGAFYAVKERATALTSLETVATCYRTCIEAVSALVTTTKLPAFASLCETFSQLAKFCISTGMRKLALNFVTPESIASQMEKANWNAQAAQYPHFSSPGEISTTTKSILATLSGTMEKLKEVHRDCPTVGMQKAVASIAFVLFCGFVEGCSRIKKMSDSGRAQLLNDALMMTQKVKSILPHTPARQLDYVMRYVRCLTTPNSTSIEVMEFVKQYHALYIARQLTSLGEKDWVGAKKKDIEALLKQCGHEDRTPTTLFDD